MSLKTDEYITVSAAATSLGINKSLALRFIKKNGILPHKRRFVETKNQLTSCITIEEYNAICALRQSNGFTINGESKPAVIENSEYGWFYVIQLVPEFSSQRIKLGFAINPETRLLEHRCAAPTAVLLRTWQCKRSWERTIIDCCVAIPGTVKVSAEVIDSNPEEVISQIEKFFKLMR